MKYSPIFRMDSRENSYLCTECQFCCFDMPQEVMRNLVKRYVAAMIRDAKTEEGLTEENFKVTVCILITRGQVLQSREPDAAHLQSELATWP